MIASCGSHSPNSMISAEPDDKTPPNEPRGFAKVAVVFEGQ